MLKRIPIFKSGVWPIYSVLLT